MSAVSDTASIEHISFAVVTTKAIVSTPVLCDQTLNTEPRKSFETSKATPERF
jgi:hypothetical protein